MSRRDAMKKTSLLLVFALALAGSACARRVVADPEVVQKMNGAAWTVKSEPQGQK